MTLPELLLDPASRAARKVLVAPTSQTGSAVREALVRAGVATADLRVSTVTGFARRIVELDDPGSGPGLVGPDTMVVQVACMLHGMAQDDGRPLVRSARTVARTIGEARMAGIDAATFRRVARGDLGRIAASVFERLEQDLSNSNRRDAARLVAQATDAVDRMPDGVLPEILLVLDGTPLPDRALALVEALRGRARLAYRVSPPSPAAAPPFSAAAARLDWPVLDFACGEGEARTVFLEASGRDVEVSAVARRIVEDGLRLDDVELAYTRHAPYLGLVRETFERYGIAGTYAAGVPLSGTRPGQAVRLFLGWVAEGTPSGRLVAMLRTGHVVLPGDDAAASAARALAGRLDRVRVGRGPGGYRSALSREACSTLDPLLDLVPRRDTVQPGELAGVAADFLRRFAPPHAGAEPDRVHLEIEHRILELGQAQGRAPVRPLATQFSGLLHDMFVHARAARPGHVHVVPSSSAGYSGRPHVFVVGMDDESFAASVSESGLIPDDRRSDGSVPGTVRLPGARDVRLQTAWHLARVFGAASGTVALVRTTYDSDAAREVYPSPAWIQARDSNGGVEPERHGRRPACGTGAPSRPFTIPEVLLTCRGEDDARRHLDLLAPALTRGARSLAKAAAPEWTAFDGRVAVAHDPWSSASGLSPTLLETLAVCPFAYFLRHVLRVDPPDRRDDDRWILPNELGTLVHEAFRDYVHDWMDRGEPGPPDVLRELLETRLQTFVRRHEPPTPAVVHRCRQELEIAGRMLLADVDRARRDGRIPVAVERGFGRRDANGDEEPNARYDTRIGALSIPLRGVVDRVDRQPDGRYAVIDYKTGRAEGYSSATMDGLGSRLQWALYAHAVRDMVGGEVATSGYLFVGAREAGLRLFAEPPGPDTLEDRLHDLAALPVLGHFPQAAGSGACGHCDFRRACGDLDRRKREIAGKRAATPADSALTEALDHWTTRVRTS